MISFIPYLFVCLTLGVAGYFLAKDKGRHAGLWAILCLIPGINAACMFFLVGSTNLRIERKLDAILEARTDI